MAASEVTIRTPPPEAETPAGGQQVKPTTGKQQGGPAPAAFAELAKLAASEGGRRVGAKPPCVFEGSGQRDPGKPDSEAEIPPTQQASAPVVGGIRVMPAANDEMQRILAARLQKSG